jgi:hypothetical protein
MCAPFIKIPTIVAVLANVINRSNLVVITALLVTMSMREMTSTDSSSATHRAYTVALALSCFSLVFNVVKYMRFPERLLALGRRRTPTTRNASEEEDPDVSLRGFT